MDEESAIGWRRDADTSRTIRVLWAVGSGGLLAAIGLIVLARFIALTGGGGTPVLLAGVVVIVVGVISLVALTIGTGQDSWLERFLPEDGPLPRVVDAVAGAALMAGLVLVLAEGVGGGLGHGLAAATIPVALIMLILSTFLRSVGALEPEEARLSLYDPDATVDLETVESVSRVGMGNVVIMRLRYAQPDGQYVPGPRWLVVPPVVAREVDALVRA